MDTAESIIADHYRPNRLMFVNRDGSHNISWVTGEYLLGYIGGMLVAVGHRR